eukprot:COSAG02_NODE_3180_length_7217_cov_2.502810_1_plen_109_part_00
MCCICVLPTFAIGHHDFAVMKYDNLFCVFSVVGSIGHNDIVRLKVLVAWFSHDKIAHSAPSLCTLYSGMIHVATNTRQTEGTQYLSVDNVRRRNSKPVLAPVGSVFSL